MVKLVKNFRSHRGILQYPNHKFYESELQPCADRTITDRYLNSDYLPSTGKNFPVVFHSIAGKDTREASSPSFFNIEEILQVQEYVQRLKAHRKIKTSKSFALTPHQFGFYWVAAHVLTPSRRRHRSNIPIPRSVCQTSRATQEHRSQGQNWLC